jgi:DMSO/TMAO reductase YedYZ molybdopterin-dependent catalytic subunit
MKQGDKIMLDNILNRVRPERKYSQEELAERLPPGQSLTEKWPVLHYGGVPHTDLKKWTFRTFGLVENPTTWAYEEFLALPHGKTESVDIHCVTRWSKFENVFEGIPFREIYDRVKPKPEAKFVLVHAEQGFTTNLPIEDLLAPNVLFAYKNNDEDLTDEHGWPMRLVVPHLYFWKSAKWVRGMEFLAQDEPGFWEDAGYHMRGDPWKEERYRYSW